SRARRSRELGRARRDGRASRRAPRQACEGQKEKGRRGLSLLDPAFDLSLPVAFGGLRLACRRRPRLRRRRSGFGSKDISGPGLGRLGFPGSPHLALLGCPLFSFISLPVVIAFGRTL